MREHETTGERLHALDAVRGFALLAGIFLHASVSFLQSPKGPVWVVMDNHRSLALAVLFHVLHVFRMTTFFFIAGYFAHLTLHRKGERAFIRDRLKRIGLPLVVAWPIVFTAIVAASIWGAVTMMHAGQKPPPTPPYHFPAFPWTHLWFLYVLLLLYAGVLMLRRLALASDRAGAIGKAFDALTKRLANAGLLAPALAIPTALALFFTPHWLMWFGVPTPDSSLVPNFAATTAFSVAFGFGFVAHRQPGLLDTWRRQWALHLAAALLFTGAGLSITGLAPVVVPESDPLTKAAFAACYAVASWSWTFALVGIALRFLSGFSATRRYIADASYWFYIAHLPIVIALQVAVSQLDWHWTLKFAFILVVTFNILFASYAWFVRGTFIGAILNGRRLGRPILPSPQLATDPA